MSYQFERLESRLLLAATAFFNDGTLTIFGDHDDDAIRIEGIGAGDLNLFTDTDGDGKVDASSLQNFMGVENIRIGTRLGADAIGIFNIDISGDLTIRTGIGKDSLLMEGNTVGGSLSVSTGQGRDVTGAMGNDIGETASIRTGHGKDDLQLDSNTFNEKFKLILGAGNDSALFTANTFAAQSAVRGRAGRDLFIDTVDPNPPNLAVTNIEQDSPDYPSRLLARVTARYNDCLDRVSIV